MYNNYSFKARRDIISQKAIKSDRKAIHIYIIHIFKELKINCLTKPNEAKYRENTGQTLRP
jgi:hypothetical protein